MNPGVFIAIFLVIIFCVNYFGIKFFGEFEFWLSSFKVVVVIGLIIFSLVLALGGGPDHDRKGFRYWKDPGYVFAGESARLTLASHTVVLTISVPSRHISKEATPVASSASGPAWSTPPSPISEPNWLV